MTGLISLRYMMKPIEPHLLKATRLIPMLRQHAVQRRPQSMPLMQRHPTTTVPRAGFPAQNQITTVQRTRLMN